MKVNILLSFSVLGLSLSQACEVMKCQDKVNQIQVAASSGTSQSVCEVYEALKQCIESADLNTCDQTVQASFNTLLTQFGTNYCGSDGGGGDGPGCDESYLSRHCQDKISAISSTSNRQQICLVFGEFKECLSYGNYENCGQTVQEQYQASLHTAEALCGTDKPVDTTDLCKFRKLMNECYPQISEMLGVDASFVDRCFKYDQYEKCINVEGNGLKYCPKPVQKMYALPGALLKHSCSIAVCSKNDILNECGISDSLRDFPNPRTTSNCIAVEQLQSCVSDYGILDCLKDDVYSTKISTYDSRLMLYDDFCSDCKRGAIIDICLDKVLTAQNFPGDLHCNEVAAINQCLSSFGLSQCPVTLHDALNEPFHALTEACHGSTITSSFTWLLAVLACFVFSS